MYLLARIMVVGSRRVLSTVECLWRERSRASVSRDATSFLGSSEEPIAEIDNAVCNQRTLCAIYNRFAQLMKCSDEMAHKSLSPRNQAIVQADKVNIQCRNSGNDGRNTKCSYVEEEIIKGNNVQNDVGNTQRTLRTTSSGFAANMLLVKQDEARVTLTNEHNNFLVVDATRMEEIEELSANICLMARSQPTNIDSDAWPRYDSAFLSEAQKSSTSYVNPLFDKDNQEQKYPKQSKIINDTISDD
ncbi:hypothetical protein Tco_1164345 [Tanacetum coccineum]